MTRSRPPLSPETRALLDREREIPALPAAVKARAMARARAALVAAPARVPVPAFGSSRSAPWLRWAAIIALTCMGGVAVGAAAYRLRAPALPPANAPAAPHPIAAPPPVLALEAPAPALAPPEPVAEAPMKAPVLPRLSRAEAAREELHLLRRARAAVARGDFAAALAPIAEHTRRFKDGRLAEEREALRVKALAGLGRTEDARRAAAGFQARFPRSVLLPAVSKMPTAEP